MGQKTLLLFIILTLFSFVSVFGQNTQDAQSKTVAKVDTLQAANKARAGTRAEGTLVTPGKPFKADDITPAKDRDEDGSIRKSIFYSNAPMYVAENTATNSDKVTMYVEGTMKYDNEAEIHQEGETQLTGDFVSVKNVANKDSQGQTLKPPVPLFLTANTARNGLIRFVGKGTRQYIIREDMDGKLLPNSSTNDLKVGANGEYVMAFPTIKVDKDGVKTLADVVDKATGKSTRGDYDIERQDLLAVSSNVAMSVLKLDVSQGNRFSVDVVSQGLELKAQGFTGNPSKVDYYTTNPAYINILAMDTTNGGHNEVNMRLYNFKEGLANDFTLDEKKPLIADTEVRESNMLNGITVATNPATTTHATFMRGFTSPFDDLRSDYMFYHVLTKPYANSITGGTGPIAGPDTEIKRGEGYFMAMDVSNAYFENIQDIWHEDYKNASNVNDAYTKRARGGYNFSRLVQRVRDEIAGDRKGARFSLYTFDKSEATNDIEDFEKGGRYYTGQRFNIDKVKVEIDGPRDPAKNAHGTVFLGNPFMTPINISGLLARYDGTMYVTDVTGANEDDEGNELTKPFMPHLFGSDTKVRVAHALNAAELAQLPADALVLRSQYWIPHSALVANATLAGKAVYAYNVKYDNVVAVTKGTSTPDPFNRIIEPMQMFLVQAATSGTFEFIEEMKTFKGKPFPVEFLTAYNELPNSRSIDIQGDDDVNKFVPKDWFMIEATSNKGGSSISVDRTAVRFFNDATLVYQDKHDEEKMFTETKNIQPKTQRGRSIAAEVLETSAPSNVLFTKSVGLNPKKLLSYGVGYDTKEIPLYYIASGEPEDVTMTFTGMEGFDKLQGVRLIDRFENVDREVYEGFSYSFVTMPGRETVDGENRFILRFGEDDGTDPSYTEEPITCYYSGSTLHIGGLNEKDLDSKVQIFDLQGRLMGNTTINNAPNMEYHKALGQGTFIVNIIGNRNYKTKFVNLHNY